MKLTKYDLETLSIAFGPSGFEKNALETWLHIASGLQAMNVEMGIIKGNAYVETAGSRGKKIMISGHIDQVGIIINHIDEDGFARFRTIGGFDQTVFVGQRVLVKSLLEDNFVLGIVGRAATHEMSDEEQDNCFSVSDLWIDFLGDDTVTVGSCGIFWPFAPVFVGDFIVGNALDDRVGAFIALAVALDCLDHTNNSVVAIANTREETSQAGGLVAANNVLPDIAIILDLGIATDHPDGNPAKFGDIKVGGGPIITVGGNSDPELAKSLIHFAKNAHIEYQIEAIPGLSWTDMDQVSVAAKGIPSVLVSVACRYAHTPVEVVSWSDIKSTIKLLTQFVRSYK